MGSRGEGPVPCQGMKEGIQRDEAAVSSLLLSPTSFPSSSPRDMEPDKPCRPGGNEVGVKDIQTRYKQTLILLDQ